MEGDVQPYVGVRASASEKFGSFKKKITSVLLLPQHDYMRCVIEKKGTGELILLKDDNVSLRDIDYRQGTKVSLPPSSHLFFFVTVRF